MAWPLTTRGAGSAFPHSARSAPKTLAPALGRRRVGLVGAGRRQGGFVAGLELVQEAKGGFPLGDRGRLVPGRGALGDDFGSPGGLDGAAQAGDDVPVVGLAQDDAQ